MDRHPGVVPGSTENRAKDKKLGSIVCGRVDPGTRPG